MGRKPCCSKEGLSRGAWSAREDKILKDYITAHGKGKWRDLPKRAGLKRCGKSCRLRWLNYLRPDISRGNISRGEEELIVRLHKLLGNRWSLIAGRLPGRTDNEIKNYWNTYLSKKTSSPREEARKESTKKVVDIEANELPPADQVVRTKAVRCSKAYIPDHNSPIAINKKSDPTSTGQTWSSPPPDTFLDIPLGFDVEEFMAGVEYCDDGGLDQACDDGSTTQEEWRELILDHPQRNVVASELRNLSALLDSWEINDDPMGDASGPSSVNYN